MKVSSVITITLLVGLVFTIFVSIVGDMQGQYPNNIENSSWAGYYDSNYTDAINESASNIKNRLEEIGDEDNWFIDVAQGAVAIPFVLFDVFVMIIASLTNLLKITVRAGTDYVPAEVMIFGIVALLVAVVISLINWWKSDTPA